MVTLSGEAFFYIIIQVMRAAQSDKVMLVARLLVFFILCVLTVYPWILASIKFSEFRASCPH